MRLLILGIFFPCSTESSDRRHISQSTTLMIGHLLDVEKYHGHIRLDNP